MTPQEHLAQVRMVNQSMLRSDDRAERHNSYVLASKLPCMTCHAPRARLYCDHCDLPRAA